MENKVGLPRHLLVRQIFMDFYQKRLEVPEFLAKSISSFNPFLTYPEDFWEEKESLAQNYLEIRNKSFPGFEDWRKPEHFPEIYSYQWSVDLYKKCLSGFEIMEEVEKEAHLCGWSLEDIVEKRCYDLGRSADLILNGRDLGILSFLLLTKISEFVFFQIDCEEAEKSGSLFQDFVNRFVEDLPLDVQIAMSNRQDSVFLGLLSIIEESRGLEEVKEVVDFVDYEVIPILRRGSN